jgi:hypothetical protein
MTVGEYITHKLGQFGLTLTSDDITVAGYDPNADISTTDPKKVMVMLIPDLLVMPDITQGSTSVNYDRDAVLKYYAWLCKQTGEEDTLTDKPSATMYGNRW